MRPAGTARSGPGLALRWSTVKKCNPLGRDAMSRTPDLSVVYCGSAFLLRATSPTGQQWIVRHIPGNARWFGGVVAVEHRYIDAIIQGAIDDGLSTSGGRTVL